MGSLDIVLKDSRFGGGGGGCGRGAVEEGG